MAAVLSQAQIVNLVDQNSVAQVDTGSSNGMFNWLVDGQDQLYQQWFWFRVGNAGPEQSIDTIGPAVIQTPDARTLYTTYSNGAYSVEVDYLMTGGLAGSGTSDIGETIRINNLGNSVLNFHFFQYSDFDLGATLGGQTVTLGTNLQGKFNEAYQTGPGATLDESVTVAAPGANHGEAAFFNTTLVKLSDGFTDNLSDAAGPVGPGDVTWALQWDLNIGAGSSVLISKDKHIQLAVPEPSTFVLMGLGLIGIAARKRRK